MTETANNAKSLKRPLKRRLRRWKLLILRPLNWIVVSLLLLVATYLSLGRLLMPVLDTQRDWLQAQLETSLGVEIQVGELAGDWFAFSPILRLNDIDIIQSRNSPVSHSLRQLDVFPDIPRSLLRRQLVIDRIVIDGLSLLLEEDASGRWNLSYHGPRYRHRRNRNLHGGPIANRNEYRNDKCR